jgi:DNA-binding response OmpR family regulator
MLQHLQDSQSNTILVVEDNAAIGAFLLEAIYLETPYQAVLATRGQQALEFARQVKPVLFILNYYLPDLDGIELYDRLHAIKGFADIPAIMLSADLPEQEVAKRPILGLDKPFNMRKLLASIERLVVPATNGAQPKQEVDQPRLLP